MAAVARPRAEDMAGNLCVLSKPVADAVARRVRPKGVVAIWFGDELDLSALPEPPFSTLLSAISRAGATLNVVLPEAILEKLDEAARAGLRNASHRYGFSIHIGDGYTAPNGAWLIAALIEGDRTTGFLSRDPLAATAGSGWGKGVTAAVVEMLLNPPLYRLVEAEKLERDQLGDRVRLLSGDAGRPIRLFGKGIVNKVIRGGLEAAGLWRPGALVGITYSDRYLRAPLSAVLLMRTLAALRDELAEKVSDLPITLFTSPLDQQSEGGQSRLHQNWRFEDDRKSTIVELARRLNFGCTFLSGEVPHGRKMTLRFNDDTTAVIFFDQGFGYWRASGPNAYDFRAKPKAQADALLNCAAFVSSEGESYVAIMRK